MWRKKWPIFLLITLCFKFVTLPSTSSSTAGSAGSKSSPSRNLLRNWGFSFATSFCLKPVVKDMKHLSSVIFLSLVSRHLSVLFSHIPIFSEPLSDPVAFQVPYGAAILPLLMFPGPTPALVSPIIDCQKHPEAIKNIQPTNITNTAAVFKIKLSNLGNIWSSKL